jgi:hypothetical protein
MELLGNRAESAQFDHYRNQDILKIIKTKGALIKINSRNTTVEWRVKITEGCYEISGKNGKQGYSTSIKETSGLLYLDRNGTPGVKSLQ